ncbi:F0F1 ATP synthase subunit gamma [Spirosoma spitsbergense]|uniref:F0F1 ATP synthase subunit gamma n=1 Tax=Spirosoma spitsbergense TaxID=431554 RepID=UPI000A070C22|nr:F0F1 ATP synthase subunit gamma [Spirosoma spitsbergense]
MAPTRRSRHESVGVWFERDLPDASYRYVSLFNSCAEPLVSEHFSRLESIQRAEKNINKLRDDLPHNDHRERQSAIDEELFDLVSGFEALKIDKAKGERP